MGQAEPSGGGQIAKVGSKLGPGWAELGTKFSQVGPGLGGPGLGAKCGQAGARVRSQIAPSWGQG